ncbi:putative membrane protein [Escherichia phage AV124]|nr:putative membrane protein [Escherichia phage AV124]
MIGFWEWLTMHNNWVPGVIMYAMMLLWALVIAFRSTWKGYVVAIVLMAGVGGTLFNFLSTYLDGYGMYQRHYTTCAKPEAVVSFYVFDAKKERCYKPVVGFAPVDDNQVKTLTPKQMETGEWL